SCDESPSGIAAICYRPSEYRGNLYRLILCGRGVGQREALGASSRTLDGHVATPPKRLDRQLPRTHAACGRWRTEPASTTVGRCDRNREAASGPGICQGPVPGRQSDSGTWATLA